MWWILLKTGEACSIMNCVESEGKKPFRCPYTFLLREIQILLPERCTSSDIELPRGFVPHSISFVINGVCPECRKTAVVLYFRSTFRIPLWIFRNFAPKSKSGMADIEKNNSEGKMFWWQQPRRYGCVYGCDRGMHQWCYRWWTECRQYGSVECRPDHLGLDKTVRDEVMDGGFVQLIHNGYGGFIFVNPFAKMMRAWDCATFPNLIFDASHLYKKYGKEIEQDCTDEEFMALFWEIPWIRWYGWWVCGKWRAVDGRCGQIYRWEFGKTEIEKEDE